MKGLSFHGEKKKCHFCDKITSIYFDFCPNCGMPLTKDALHYVRMRIAGVKE